MNKINKKITYNKKTELMRKDTIDKIDFFFGDTIIEYKLPNVFSTLYLIRRDIKTCMGFNPRKNGLEKIEFRAEWPGIMSILTGIDLLGKFYEGDDKPNKSGPRFKRFLKEYFKPIRKNQINAIYQLRNSLLHAFFLYSRNEIKKDGKVIRINEYKFVLDTDEKLLIKRLWGYKVKNKKINTFKYKYQIGVLTLYKRFEISINRYLEDLKSFKNLQNNFEKMFKTYGIVSMY